MLATATSFLPFVLFAFVASITPGPTNILVLSNSARFGFKSTLPIVLGACTSAALLVWLAGSGITHYLKEHSDVQHVMRWVGAFWLSYLAWQIFRASAQVTDPKSSPVQIGFWGAAALQWVNPKTWMMAIAVVSVFADDHNNRQIRLITLSVIFFCVSLPCLTSWAWLGTGARLHLDSPIKRQKFNQFMALLLFVSAWLSFIPN